MKPKSIGSVFIAVVACSWVISSHSQIPDFAWTLISERSTDEWAYANAAFGVAVDAQNNLIVSGAASGPISLGEKTSSCATLCALLTKVTSTGTVVWLNRLEAAETVVAPVFQRNVALDAQGNVFVCGTFSGTFSLPGKTITTIGLDGYVAKYDAAGSLLWLQLLSGDADDLAESLTVDQAGNCYVLGDLWRSGPVSPLPTTVFEDIPVTTVDGGWYSEYLVKLSPDGVKLRTKIFGYVGPDSPGGRPFGRSITLDRSGNIHVCGALHGPVLFDGIPLGDSLPFEDNSGFAGGAFLLKYDPDWNLLWAKDATGPAAGTLGVFNDVKTDQEGNCFVTGFFRSPHQVGADQLPTYGEWDFWLAKFSPSGNVLWARSGGGAGIDSGERLAINSSGDCIVTGYFQGAATFAGTNFTSEGLQDLFVTKYTKHGEPVWFKQLGAASAAYTGLGISLDSAGNAFLAGSVVTNAVLTEGGFVTSRNPLENPGDIFLAKLAVGGGSSVVNTNSHVGILQVGRDSSQIVLSWPIAISNVVLETSHALDSSADWQSVTIQSQTISDRFVVRLSPEQTAAFFRLRKTQ